MTNLIAQHTTMMEDQEDTISRLETNAQMYAENARQIVASQKHEDKWFDESLQQAQGTLKIFHDEVTRYETVKDDITSAKGFLNDKANWVNNRFQDMILAVSSAQEAAA